MYPTPFKLAAAGLLLIASHLAADAQAFPTRTIKVINSFAPGGPTDEYVRPMVEKLGGYLGQPVVIENVVGASGAIAATTVARAQPDGHTLLVISNTHAINETLNPSSTYSLLRDFEPITVLFTSEHVVVVHPTLPVHSVKELVELAKKEPGGITYASSGHGSSYHLATELFKAVAGVDLLHVPYKASAQARTDLLGGHVKVFFDLSASMAPHIESGALRGLATTGSSRSSILPNLPTVIEAGVPGYTAEAWVALLAPKATPPEIVERIRSEILKFMKLPETEAMTKRRGMISVGSTSTETGEFLKSEVSKWAGVIRAAKLKTD